MSYEVIRDEDGKPLEVRATLPDGRIAISGVVGGRINVSVDIPIEVFDILDGMEVLAWI